MAIDNTHNKIVEVATKLFGRYGFYKTSMDEVARISRKAKGSLYYHFSSKEALFTEVVSGEIQNLKRELAIIVTDPKLTADQKIKSYLIRRMEVLDNAANYHETLKADFYEHFDFVDGLRKDLDEWEKQQIKTIIGQGIQEEIFDNQDVNIDVILDVFIMVLRGLEIPFYLQGKYNEYVPYFDDLLNILIKGMRK